MKAAQKGHGHIVKSLLNFGARKNIQNEVGNDITSFVVLQKCYTKV